MKTDAEGSALPLFTLYVDSPVGRSFRFVRVPAYAIPDQCPPKLRGMAVFAAHYLSYDPVGTRFRLSDPASAAVTWIERVR